MTFRPHDNGNDKINLMIFLQEILLISDDFMSVTTFHRAIQYGDLNDIRKFVRER
jgi:hypothetical protein